MPWPGGGGVGWEDGGALSLGRGHGGEGGRGGGDQWGGERGLLAARKVAVSRFGEGGVESRECCGQGWATGGGRRQRGRSEGRERRGGATVEPMSRRHRRRRRCRRREAAACYPWAGPRDAAARLGPPLSHRHRHPHPYTRPVAGSARRHAASREPAGGGMQWAAWCVAAAPRRAPTPPSRRERLETPLCGRPAGRPAIPEGEGKRCRRMRPSWGGRLRRTRGGWRRRGREAEGGAWRLGRRAPTWLPMGAGWTRQREAGRQRAEGGTTTASRVGGVAVTCRRRCRCR